MNSTRKNKTEYIYAFEIEKYNNYKLTEFLMLYIFLDILVS